MRLLGSRASSKTHRWHSMGRLMSGASHHGLARCDGRAGAALRCITACLSYNNQQQLCSMMSGHGTARLCQWAAPVAHPDARPTVLSPWWRSAFRRRSRWRPLWAPVRCVSVGLPSAGPHALLRPARRASLLCAAPHGLHCAQLALRSHRCGAAHPVPAAVVHVEARRRRVVSGVTPELRGFCGSRARPAAGCVPFFRAP